MPSPLTFLKSLAHHNEEPTATPRKGILRRSPAKLKKATIRHPPVDKGEPEKNNTEGRVQEDDGIFNSDVPFHSSIPNGSVDGWRDFPPPHRVDTIMMKGGRPVSAQPRHSEELSENPIVSHYYTTSQTPQAQIPQPIPPSRTWSTIPSIQRDSHVRRGTAHPSIAPSAARDQSTPFHQSANSEQLSLLTVGQQPSDFEHERRFIEYPSTPSAKRANLTHSAKSTSLRRANTATTQQDASMSYRDEIDSDPEVYHYIVPTGVDVIFQDEDGNEITRTGKTVKKPGHNRPLKSAPIIVHDEFGTFLYRDTMPAPKGSSRERDRDYEGMPRIHSARNKGLQGRIGTETGLPSWILSSPASLSPRSKIIKIDQQGNQTFLNKSTNLSTHGGR